MSYAEKLLDEVLQPMAADLANPAVEDVAVNAPYAFWVFQDGAWTWKPAPSLDYQTLEGIAVLCGSLRRQDISRTQPMIGGDLHTGHRFQCILPPAVPPGTASLTFRRPSDTVAPLAEIPQRYRIGGWNKWAEQDSARDRATAHLLQAYDSGDIVGFLRGIVHSHRTPVIAGPTGAGKTFLSKSLLAEASPSARVVTIEDALEMVVTQPNQVRLLYSAGGEGAVTPGQCLHAALRMRPDLVPVQELRDPYTTWVYLNEIATGHAGSPTTVHGATAGQAVRRIFALLKGSAEGASIQDAVLLDMMAAAISVIVPLSTEGGVREMGAVWFADDAARRGETIAHLMNAP